MCRHAMATIQKEMNDFAWLCLGKGKFGLKRTDVLLSNPTCAGYTDPHQPLRDKAKHTIPVPDRASISRREYIIAFPLLYF